MVDNKRKIICLMGPTASGKTALAIELVKKFPFEIISVDSAMIYRGMDIGAAKPTASELEIAPHHLIDICDPKESYSAGRFREDALTKIDEIFTKGKIPLLVGGTMLYFRVLQQGISKLPMADENVRADLRAKEEKFGLDYLYSELQKFDPKTAAILKKTDSQRIQRALEVYEITNKSLSELKELYPPQPLSYESINIAISASDISILRERIKKRFFQMLKLGFIEEVEQLYKRGDLNINLPAIRTVGYRQVWQYLSGQTNYDQLLELVPIATNQLAKRQMTWLRNWGKDISWFYGNNEIVNVESMLMNSIGF